MAYFHYYCPHCKEFMESVNGPLTHGNPIKVCPACKKSYIDPYCTEPALRPYKPHSVWRLFLDTFLSGGCVMALLITWIVSSKVTSTTLWIIFGVSFVVFGLLSFFWFLSSRENLEKKRLQRWQESDRRLRSPKHAIALKLYGYLVPAEYLPPRYWEQKESLTLPGATVKSLSGGTKKSPKPHRPGGSDRY